MVCLDESPVQLIGETRTPVPARPGQTRRFKPEQSGTQNTPGAQDKGDTERSLPDRSSEPDRHEEPAEALADPSSSDDTRPLGTTVYTKDGSQVILTTREAAALLTLAPRTMERYRVRGGGPRYLKIGRTVRYPRLDLLEWELTMRRDGMPEG